MTSTLDHFGPWAADLDQGERLARLRSMRAIARLIVGPRGSEFIDALRKAETDDSALGPALVALDRLPSLDRRRVLSSYAHTM